MAADVQLDMSGRLLAATLVWAALVLLLVAPPLGAAQQGYVSYSVTYVSGNRTHTFVINESVSATTNPNLSLFTLVVRAASWNFTYSSDINSSLQPFPYVPALTNRSFSYQTAKYSFVFTLTYGGKTQISYGGQTYGGKLYLFGGRATYNHTTYVVLGNITAFPSGLLYSAGAQLNHSATINVRLLSTDLPLQASSAHSEYLTVALAAGAVIAAFALGLPLRRSEKRAQTTRPKDYWVD